MYVTPVSPFLNLFLWQACADRFLMQVSSTDYPGHRPGQDDSWNITTFRDNLKTEIHKLDGLDMEFDLVGVDASIANAFRRILLAEVPTMAIETVYIFQNTSVIQDEVLAHRLGLIPIKADPGKFGWQNGSTTSLSTIILI
jgi:DNA-directed RNA polymerases I and III subunit RPAC1